MNNPSEDVWRNRFIIVNLVRIGATVFTLLAVVLGCTDLIVPGGMILIGLPLAIAGLIVSFMAPKWLARHWKRQDGR
jgi:hypothetical protein